MASRAKSPDALFVLSVAMSSILLALVHGVSGIPAPFGFAAALMLFMAPGVLASHWLLGNTLPGPALIPIGFALSTGLFGLAGVPVLLMHQSIEVYLWVSATILAAFLAVAALRVLLPSKMQIMKRVDKEPMAQGHVAGGGSTTGDHERGTSAGLLWLPFSFLCGVLAFVATRRVPNDNDDIWVYLSWVRDLISAEHLALNNPYFGWEVGKLSRVHVNGWLVEQAALSRVSGIDPIEMVLRYLTPVLVVVALLAVYALATVLLRSGRVGVFCASAYALFHVVFIEPSVHNIGAELAVRAVEDKHAARFLVLPVALLFAVLYTRYRRWRYLGLLAFSCLTIMVVHPVVLAPLGLCMLGFGLVHVALQWRQRTAWTVMALLTLALFSVLVGPVLLAFAAGESPVALAYSTDINSTPPEVLYAMVFVVDAWRHIYELDGASYIMHPWLIMNPVILGSYILGIPFLLWRIKTSLAAQLLLGALAVVTVAVYVPPVTTFIGEELVGPNLIWRLAWPVPLLALLAVGWMLWEGLGYAQARLGRLGVGRGARGALPLALMSGLVLAAAPCSATMAVGLYREYEVAHTSNYYPDPIYPWIGDHIKRPALLLAPDAKSTAIPAYSASVNVLSYRSEGKVQNRETLERIAGSPIDFPRRYIDSYRFFSDPTLGRGDREILRRYEVDYLMVRNGGLLAEQLQTMSGFSAMEGAPAQGYGLYKVDLTDIQA